MTKTWSKILSLTATLGLYMMAEGFALWSDPQIWAYFIAGGMATFLSSVIIAAGWIDGWGSEEPNAR